MNWVLDKSDTRVAIETRAKGMLAKLAHDLSIEAREVSGTASIEAVGSGARAKARLEVTVARLEVAGILKGNDVDRAGLSGSDRTEIQRRIREEVLAAKNVVLELEATLASGLDPTKSGKQSGEITGKVEIGRGSTRITSRAEIEVDADKKRVFASGRAKLNMPSLGITPPKGPLGAFRVSDDVEVVYRLAFVLGESAS